MLMEGMGVFRLFFVKTKIGLIKIGSCPGYNKANLLISAIRRRQRIGNEQGSRSRRIVLQSIMFAVLERNHTSMLYSNLCYSGHI